MKKNFIVINLVKRVAALQNDVWRFIAFRLL